MPAPDDLRSTTLVHRLALLSLAELDDGGRMPANVLDVLDRCRDHAGAVTADVVGAPTEVDVTRALNELAASELVAEVDRADVSAVGKGRPAYEPAVDRSSVLEECGADGRLDDVVARVRDR